MISGATIWQLDDPQIVHIGTTLILCRVVHYCKGLRFGIEMEIGAELQIDCLLVGDLPFGWRVVAQFGWHKG
jgi:hypothetical protein